MHNKQKNADHLSHQSPGQPLQGPTTSFLRQFSFSLGRRHRRPTRRNRPVGTARSWGAPSGPPACQAAKHATEGVPKTGCLRHHKREFPSGLRLLQGFSRARRPRNPRFYWGFAYFGQALARACPQNRYFGENFEACTDFPYPRIDEFFSWIFTQNANRSAHYKRLPPRLFQVIPSNRQFFDDCGTAILP